MDGYLLGGLFFSALSSATILPGTSDVAFTALVHQYPHLAWAAWWSAGVGNTLGGVITYYMGKKLTRQPQNLSPKWQNHIHRFGAWTLLFSWVPIIGDVLPLAAGYLRLNVYGCVLALAVGKFARYGLLWWGWEKMAVYVN